MGDVIKGRFPAKQSALKKILGETIEPRTAGRMGVAAIPLAIASVANNVTGKHSDALQYAADAGGLGLSGAALASLPHFQKLPSHGGKSIPHAVMNAKVSRGLKGGIAGAGVGVLMAMLTNKMHAQNKRQGRYD